ncbi:TolC family outer membrane protein [Solemya velesiana gill symbiont]|uniref:Agglutination protein n=1 Tax=Solemya velesiana gill symbiont TaxID=1918948 RepID=A0A1T2KT59_9GAMM|nr:TolC family outer membrane protein [Solemya velesiana gill symbiont]OOZ35981.1 hypothetical protein BOW51_09440 [Solemya velesiana gill symbiont]
MNKLPAFIGSTFLTLGLALPATATADSLKDIVQHTLNSNPEVLIYKDERLARNQEVRQARSGYHPEINLNAGFGYEWSDNPLITAAGLDDVELTPIEASLDFRQMLFDGYATRSEVQRQKARANSAAFKIEEIAEKIALRTVEVYLELLKQQGLLALAEENLQAHQRIFDQIRRRSATGVSRMADFEQISGRLALAESNVLASKNNVTEAEANYLRVVGQPSADLERPGPLVEALPETVDDVVSISVENHPILHSAAADIEAARAQHKAARHGFYPRFDLEISRTLKDDIDGVEGMNEDLTAMVRMRWNLYRGRKDEARTLETTRLINKAKDIRLNAIRQAEEAARLSWASYQTTLEQLSYLRRHMESSQGTRKAYKKQFDIGQRSLLDLLDTENEVFESSSAYLKADYTHQFAQYRVLKSMGKLLAALDIQSPKETMPLQDIIYDCLLFGCWRDEATKLLSDVEEGLDLNSGN